MSQRLLTNKTNPDHHSQVKIGPVVFGGTEIPLIAGPCAVETPEQLLSVAKTLKSLGIHCLRAGAFKPRTSPYSFQGLGHEGLELLAEIRQSVPIAIISEILTIEQIEQADFALDCYQVGARNMYNFELLKALGKQNKPVLLKRGLSATVEEFLYAAEYIMAEGNTQVILCERGIRSFDSMTRNVLDLGAVALLKELTHLPVIVDPSHATGKRELIIPTSRAAIAVGADGLMVEAHPIPEESYSDAAQALSLEELQDWVNHIEPVARSIGRSLAGVQD